MALRLSNLNTSREEFTSPKVGFITSTFNISITTTTGGLGTYEIFKYRSGCLGGDGNIYVGSASTSDLDLTGHILKFDPKTENTTPLTIENQNKELSTVICGKDGNVYAISGLGTEVYRLDVFNESISLLGTFNLYGDTSYLSACLAPNGKIYGIPSDAPNVLKIDPDTETLTTFGTVSSSFDKWNSGILGPDECIYCVPTLATTILKIDTRNDTVSTFGSLVSNAWWGGCLAPNGKIYCPPIKGDRSTSILKIDPVAGTATTFGNIDLSYFTQSVLFFPSGDYYGWNGAILAPNGKIYCSPVGGTGILEINPENDTVNVIGIGSLPPIGQYVPTFYPFRWAPFVMSPDGKMYAPPWAEDKILVFGEVSNQEPADWLLSPYCNKGP